MFLCKLNKVHYDLKILPLCLEKIQKKQKRQCFHQTNAIMDWVLVLVHRVVCKTLRIEIKTASFTKQLITAEKHKCIRTCSVLHARESFTNRSTNKSLRVLRSSRNIPPASFPGRTLTGTWIHFWNPPTHFYCKPTHLRLNRKKYLLLFK